MKLLPAAPDRITSLLPHQVFVFGSNSQGRHGKGAALTARNLFGAQYGNPKGIQGQSYAIITKDLTLPRYQQLRSITLDVIEAQIVELCAYAKENPHLEFLVTRFGCQNAGYSDQEIGNLWIGKEIPPNIRLPQAFIEVINSHILADYKEYRGKCKQLSEEAVRLDPTLTLRRGHYWCPFWGSQPHWWTERPDGSIYDPSARQFPSKGEGDYIPFSGKVECGECGKEMDENDASYYGNYALCSQQCLCRLVGV